MSQRPPSAPRASVNPRPPQPYSARNRHKSARFQGATEVESVCPYCAVGCGLVVHTKEGQIINIEGNPRSPINEGTLCPKGANTFQLVHNPHRVTQVLYRAPFSDRWEVKSIDWALDRIAERLKTSRDRGFRPTTPDGKALNSVTNVGTLGGATLGIGENYLIKKLFTGGWASCRWRTRLASDTAPACPVWVRASAAARPPPSSGTSARATAC